MIENIIKEDRLVKPERKLVLIEIEEVKKDKIKLSYVIRVLNQYNDVIAETKYKKFDKANYDYGLIWFCNKRS